MTKTFIIEEKFTGYANIRIEAETEEEAIKLYNRGYTQIASMIWMIYSMTTNFVQSQRKKMTFFTTLTTQEVSTNENHT